MAVGVVACETESEPEAPGPASPTPSVPEPTAPLRATPPGLDAALARGIVPPILDDGTYRVDPFVAVLLYERLRAEPDPFAHVEADGPAPAGYRIVALEGDDVLTRLGLREGDIIEALNGIPAAGAEQIELALDAAENRLTVTIFRDALSFTHSYRFDGGLAWRDVIAGSEGEPSADPGVIGAPEAEEAEEAEEAQEAQEDPAEPERAAARKPRSSSRPSPNPRPTTPASAGIARANASACTITKRKFDELRASPSAMQSGVDVVPAIRNDVFSGYRLKTVSSRSPVHALGFRAGDKITHVNGRDLTDDAQAMALYWSLGSSKIFKVRYERGGKNLVKTIRVV